MKTRLIFYIYISLILCAPFTAFAQDLKLVYGQVTNKNDKSQNLDDVIVFPCNTVADAKERVRLIQQGVTEATSITTQGGIYEAEVAPTGALVFWLIGADPVMVEVKGKSVINAQIDANVSLEEGYIDAERIIKRDEVIEAEEAIGNQYTKTLNYIFKKEFLGNIESIGKTNARLITQVYVINANTKDTLRYMTPRVYDGEQFHKTQALWNQDPLYPIADKNTYLEKYLADSIVFQVKFEIPDKSVYHCKANIWLEDYVGTYYQDTCFIMSTARVRRPFQFLEYTFDECHLDPEKHVKPPKREQMPTDKTMKLEFKVGKAELDLSDSCTVASIETLKEEIRQICGDPQSKLTQLHLSGFSSPEGTYSRNLDLAIRRTKHVENVILSVVPPSQKDFVWKSSSGYVSGWDSLAVILERDSLLAEASAVRSIVNQYPKSIDQQGAAIKKLPYYKTIIKERLGALRQVKCKHVAEITRFLTPAEILNRYNTDEGYRNGSKRLTLNEYWHLFSLIKDTAALEVLYKRALKQSKESDGYYWVLPANNLAVSYLRRGQLDTNLLKPFIVDGQAPYFEKYIVKINKKVTVNYPEVIANQAQMFMLAGNYQRAAQLTNKVSSQYPLLDAVCRLLGRLKLGSNSANKDALYEQIESSSPRNKVVIRLYLKKYQDSTTVAALQALPQDDPLTDYFKVQYLCGKWSGAASMRTPKFNREEDPTLSMPGDTVVYDVDEARIAKIDAEVKQLDVAISELVSSGWSADQEEKDKAALLEEKAKIERGEPRHIKAECTVYDVAFHYLKRCFQKDKSYIDIARGDLDIDEELLNDVLGIKTTKKQ